MPTTRKRVRKDTKAIENERDQIIKDAFYNPKIGFMSAKKLHAKLVKDHPYITYRHVQSVLARQEVQATLEKRPQTSSFVPRYPMQNIQLDIKFLENAALQGGRYALIAIDSFSKLVDARILSRKNKDQVVPAAKELIESLLSKMPSAKKREEDFESNFGGPDNTSVYTDEGAEFTGGGFRKLLKDKKIQQIFSLGHATMIERFNRTIGEMLEKYMTSTESRTISVVLPKLIENYNGTPHESLGGLAPNEVMLSQKNISDAHLSLFKRARFKKRAKIKAGDRVFVKKKQKGKEKGYHTKFTAGSYLVDRVEVDRQVKYYYLKDGPERGEETPDDDEETAKKKKRAKGQKKAKRVGQIAGQARYLRSEIELVGDATERNENKADNAGTLEARLKGQGLEVPHHRSTAREKEVRETGIADVETAAKTKKGLNVAAIKGRVRKQTHRLGEQEQTQPQQKKTTKKQKHQSQEPARKRLRKAKQGGTNAGQGSERRSSARTGGREPVAVQASATSKAAAALRRLQ